MKTSGKIGINITVGLILSACVEQVDIEDFLESEPSGRLVAEGLITDEIKQHQVKLTRTGKAIQDEAYVPVSNAEVSIRDGAAIYNLTEFIAGSGIYLTDSIQGQVNKTYTLIIKVDNEIYEASDTMVPALKFDRADGFALSGKHPPKGYIQSPLIVFGSDAPVMLSIEIMNPKSDDKYTQLDYYAFPGIDPDNILPKSIEATLSYNEGTQIMQRKYSLSSAHYLFLRALLLETEYKGGVFGSVRSDVPTNLTNGALGFFGASQKISRIGTIGKDGKLH